MWYTIYVRLSIFDNYHDTNVIMSSIVIVLLLLTLLDIANFITNIVERLISQAKTYLVMQKVQGVHNLN